LDAPADALLVVAHDGADLVVGRGAVDRLAGDGAGHGRAQALEAGDLDAEAELRVLLPAVAVASGREGPCVGRVERHAGRAVAVTDDEAGGGLEVEVRLGGAGDLDAVGGGVEVVRPRRDLGPGAG